MRTWCSVCVCSKEASRLGQTWKKGVPVEVIPMATTPIRRKIETKFGGEATLRMSNDKAVRSKDNNIFPRVRYNDFFLFLGTFSYGQRKLLAELGVS